MDIALKILAMLFFLFSCFMLAGIAKALERIANEIKQLRETGGTREMPPVKD